MTGIDNFSAFILSAIIIIITPGIDTILVLTRSISGGKKAGIYSAIGVSMGLLVHTFAAAFGLSLILAKSALAFMVVKYLGAAYLIYMGYKALSSKTEPTELKSAPVQYAGIGKMFWTAFLSDVLNPKIAIFFLAFLPQFILISARHNPIPYLILGVAIFLIALIWCFFLALMGGRVAKLFNRNANAENWLNKISGAVFVILGIKVALTKA
ncbi:LysE family translocator [Pedobacter foliorum]|uniref:LysE family translocator n=1 Tax=Pedobacter foliorum TaxID=2739058 RepID=UPI001564D7BE|nr:LysE family translocator [Pedobacter foliorum]NRF37231.1 LysE family translocator [Pedobacter foliorum]